MYGSAKYCRRGLTGGGGSFTSIAAGNSNITVNTVGGVCSISGSLRTILATGATVQTTTLVTPPGVTSQANGLHLFEGGQAAAYFDLANDGATPVYDVAFPVLDASSYYNATLTVRCVFYRDGTKSTNGSVDFSVDVGLVTDGAGVATPTLQTTPSPDPSRLPTAINQSITTAAVVGNVVRVSASRHPTIREWVRTFWWVTAWEKLT
jgi:hypothetical protein